MMARPPKYKSEEERREAQRLQKRRSAQILRRERAGLDPATPTSELTSGERATRGKLTHKQVAEIRRLHEAEGWTLATLARQFEVSERSISAILRGESWKE